MHADPTLPGRLEACYGHGLKPDVGCAVRHANLMWLLVRRCDLAGRGLRPGGWTLAQYACGWMAHGLCLAAAAHGLYARPNRAFDEILLQPVVGMATGRDGAAQRRERGRPLPEPILICGPETAKEAP